MALEISDLIPTCKYCHWQDGVRALVFFGFVLSLAPGSKRAPVRLQGAKLSSLSERACLKASTFLSGDMKAQIVRIPHVSQNPSVTKSNGQRPRAALAW